MNRRVTWLIGAGLLVVMIFAVPEAVERVADRRGAARSADLPGELQWNNVEWFWTGTFRLEGLEGDIGPVEDLTTDHVDVGLDVWAALSGDIVVRSLDVAVPEGRITGPLRSESGAESDDEPSVETTTGQLRDRLADLRRLRLHGVDMEIRTPRLPKASWSGDVRWTPDDSLAGEGEADVRFAGARHSLPWKLEGHARVEPFSMRALVHLRPEVDSDAAPNVRIRIPPLSVGLNAVELQMDDTTGDRQITVGFHGLEASVDGPEDPAARLSGPKLMVDAVSGKPLHFRGDNLEALVAPQRLLDRGKRNRLGFGTSSSKPSEGTTGRRLLQRLIRWTEFTVRDTTLDILVRSKEGWKSYRPAEQLDLVKRGRHFAGSGEFAGGRASARATLAQGRLLPVSASFRLDGVELEEVPVVRRGRSLPSRGVRGDIGGTVDASGTIVRQNLRGTLRERISADLRVDWHDGWIRADGLAPKPVRNIDLGVDLGVEWEPALGRVQLSDSRASLGSAVVELEGSVTDWSFDPEIDFRAHLREIACERAVRALPDALLGPYRRVAIEGRAAPTLTFELPLERPSRLSLDLEGLPGSCKPLALNTRKSGWPDVQFGARPGARNRIVPTANQSAIRHWGAPPDGGVGAPQNLEPVPSNWSPNRPDDVYWLRRSFIKRVREGVDDDATVHVGPGLRTYVPLRALPRHVAGSAYLSEEIHFYNDGGWNMNLIEKAIQLDLKHEEFVYGGSTVTQQLVKNIFLTRRKTLDRKIQEALISWRIQHVVSKDRVLELYLNCIEYGDNLYGIGPAARRYFQKSARNLSPLEGALLAAIKPAPWYGDRFRARGTTPDSGWWYDRIELIMERLVKKGFITKKEAEEARPYILKWDDQGQYKPDAPKPSEEEAKVDASEKDPEVEDGEKRPPRQEEARKEGAQPVDR